MDSSVFKKLFIIGNGFDKAHGYYTSYSDFRKWMEEMLLVVFPNLPKDGNGHLIPDEEPEIPSVLINGHGEEIPDDKQSLYLLMWLLYYNLGIEADWSNFEEALYDLDLEAVINNNDWFVESSARDREGDVNLFHVAQNYAELASDLRTCVEQITQLFARWIEDVVLFDKPRLPIGSKMDEESLYLTFNYTETLEKIYKVQPCLVDHIHGLRQKAWNYYDTESLFPNPMGRIIVGHGNDHSRGFNPEYIEKETILEETIRKLRKPVDKILREHAEFWSLIYHGVVKEVYSFGFSFANVDLPYIKQIVLSLKYGKGVTWYLNTYSDIPDDNGIIWNHEYEKRIRDCGFKGKFGRYS
ncbi:MAG: bacteriophage abortive infection AbiH family protein [Lachnospiraceae bacterium]|nr:bacteriophage abortive infection AbiH family protein [Lachnospiraceae bacterium]